MTLRCEHLNFAYQSRHVLHDVHAQLRPGALTVIVGPNAAGKSTLLACMIGALRPADGSVQLDGRPVHRLSAREVAKAMAYMSQRPQVSAAFTVRQVIELGRYALPPSSQRVDEAVSMLELRDLQHCSFGELSAGQQQRVMLARAMAQVSQDGCLVLDEPTSAMDLRHIQLAIGVLREAAARGVTVVAAMHDLSMAAAAAQDAWLLTDGRLIACGPAEDVLDPARLRGAFGVGVQWIGDQRCRVLASPAQMAGSPDER